MEAAEKEINELTSFEFPYRLEASALYELIEPVGFLDVGKAFAKKELCIGFSEKENIVEVSEYVRDAMSERDGGNWLCYITPS